MSLPRVLLLGCAFLLLTVNLGAGSTRNDPTFRRVPLGRCTILAAVDPDKKDTVIHVRISRDQQTIGHHYIVQTDGEQSVRNEVTEYLIEAAQKEAVALGCLGR
jgi:hypothetical protein